MAEWTPEQWLALLTPLVGMILAFVRETVLRRRVERAAEALSEAVEEADPKAALRGAQIDAPARQVLQDLHKKTTLRRVLKQEELDA